MHRQPCKHAPAGAKPPTAGGTPLPCMHPAGTCIALLRAAPVQPSPSLTNPNTFSPLFCSWRSRSPRWTPPPATSRCAAIAVLMRPVGVPQPLYRPFIAPAVLPDMGSTQAMPCLQTACIHPCPDSSRSPCVLTLRRPATAIPLVSRPALSPRPPSSSCAAGAAEGGEADGHQGGH